MSKKLIGSFLISTIVPFVFWAGGYNFNERGDTAVLLIVTTIGVFGLAITCPLWPKGE